MDKYRDSRVINKLFIIFRTFTKSIFRAVMEGDEFVGLERSELFGIVDFIGNCGGLLGLFMGVSVLSIIEFIYYFTIRFFVRAFTR
jgi:hypothetical protein